MRAINADKLKKKAFGKRGGLIHTTDIDAMPTIKPERPSGREVYQAGYAEGYKAGQEERKTGKWNRRKGMYEVGFKCSECNAFSIAETPYCSFCGARMVQEGEDDG